jgi:hypothetical protein
VAIVIEAYAKTMQVTFAQSIVTASVGLILLLVIRLPKLSNAPVEISIGE